MKYLVSEVERWGREIDALPAPDPGRRRVGKEEAVTLIPEASQQPALVLAAAASCADVYSDVSSSVFAELDTSTPNGQIATGFPRKLVS
jgi:hypothetical protein